MKNITLRALEPDDIDAIFRWENDPSLWEWSAEHTPFSRHRLKEYLVDAGLQDVYSSRQLRLMAMDGIVSVGCVDIFDFDPFHHHASVGIVVDSQLRHMGYASAIITALEQFGRERLQLHTLGSEVAESNIVSQRLFEGCGFEKTGRRKEWLYRDGQWEDVIVYGKNLK